MSGLVWASLAMLATIHPRREFTWMWVWLLVALVVDGVDGTLARRARVSEIIPWFDGGIVDIVVDYLTWTFIPAVFMYVALPMGPRPLAGLLMALVLSSSMFCYANKQWKSTDYYFVGFPAAWNIVALMFYVLQTPGVFNIIVTLIFVVLTLVPTHYAHPARVKRFRALNIGAVAVWFLATCWLVAIYPHRPLSLVAVLIVSAAVTGTVGALARLGAGVIGLIMGVVLERGQQTAPSQELPRRSERELVAFLVACWAVSCALAVVSNAAGPLADARYGLTPAIPPNSTHRRDC